MLLHANLSLYVIITFKIFTFISKKFGLKRAVSHAVTNREHRRAFLELGQVNKLTPKSLCILISPIYFIEYLCCGRQ